MKSSKIVENCDEKMLQNSAFYVILKIDYNLKFKMNILFKKIKSNILNIKIKKRKVIYYEKIYEYEEDRFK